MVGNSPGSLRNGPAESASESFPWFSGAPRLPDQRSEPAAPIVLDGDGAGADPRDPAGPDRDPVLPARAPAAPAGADPQAVSEVEVPAISAARSVWTESRVRTAVLVVLCLLAVVILRTGAATGSGTEAIGNWNLVSASMLQTLTASEGVAGASGGYLPGIGLVFYAELSQVARESLDTWLLALISPMSSRLSELPSGESLVWHLEATGDDAYSQLVRVPGDAVTNPSEWSKSVSAPVTDPAVLDPATVQPSATATATAATDPTPQASTTATATGSAAPEASASATASAATDGGGDSTSDDFAGGAEKWTTLTGAWAVSDGVYHQTDASGYDLISQLTATVPATYDIQVKVRAVSDKLGAGLLIGQPQSGTRNGATLIDVTDGSYLRWGTYSEGGTYTFVGGNGLPGSAGKGEWHVLKASVLANKTVIYWDDKNIGEIKSVPKGGVGLVTSVSAADFDDFSVKAR